jgi:hypothetical protein
VTWSAWAAICGIDWMAEEPVPMTATVWPVKSTPSFGQLPVRQVGPLKVSAARELRVVRHRQAAGGHDAERAVRVSPRPW